MRLLDYLYYRLYKWGQYYKEESPHQYAVIALAMITNCLVMGIILFLEAIQVTGNIFTIEMAVSLPVIILVLTTVKYSKKVQLDFEKRWMYESRSDEKRRGFFVLLLIVCIVILLVYSAGYNGSTKV